MWAGQIPETHRIHKVSTPRLDEKRNIGKTNHMADAEKSLTELSAKDPDLHLYASSNFKPWYLWIIQVCWPSKINNTKRDDYLLDLWELNIFGGGGMGLLRGSLSADDIYISLSCISSRRRFTQSCLVSSEGAWKNYIR